MQIKLLAICLFLTFVLFGCSHKEKKKEILNVSCSFKTVVVKNGPLALRSRIDYSDRKDCNEYNGTDFYSSLPCEVRIQIFRNLKERMTENYYVYLDGKLPDNAFRGYEAGAFENIWIDKNSIKFMFTQYDYTKFRYEISRATGNIKLVVSSHRLGFEERENRQKHVEKRYYDQRKIHGKQWYGEEHFKSPFNPQRDEMPNDVTYTLDQLEYDTEFYGKCSNNKKNLF
jgi:hypothetical protein